MLKRKRKKMGSASWSQEYRHIPMVSGERLVKEAWIKYWDNVPKKFDRVIMSIDPAVKDGEANDFTGVCVVGVKGDKVFELYSE
jgi:phage terminase large subunit-like protein